jgi:hypothetical protein
VVLNVDLGRSSVPLAVNEDAGDYPIRRLASSHQWRAYLAKCAPLHTIYPRTIPSISQRELCLEQWTHYYFKPPSETAKTSIQACGPIILPAGLCETWHLTLGKDVDWGCFRAGFRGEYLDQREREKVTACCIKTSLIYHQIFTVCILCVNIIKSIKNPSTQHT